MVHESIKELITIDGHIISLHIFAPTEVDYQESNYTGVVLALHGLSEYTERYHHLAELTCQKNKVFAVFNLRGHGSNALKKGDVPNFSSFILDIIFAFNTLKKLFPKIDKKSFALFGHSFGGLLATYSASILLGEVKRIFLSAPLYASHHKISSWKLALATNMSHLFPKLSVPIEFDTNHISNNPINNKKYKNDPQILKTLTLRFGNFLLEALNEKHLRTAMKNISAEVTLLLPGDDKIVDTNFTKQILSSFTTKLSVWEIEGAGHESFNEVKDLQQIAFSHYEKWLDKI